MQLASGVGRYVGRQDNSYDFERNGERIRGTSRKAFFTDESLQVSEYKVREDQAGLLDSLQFGQVYVVTAQPFARNNRVEWVLQTAEAQK